MTSPSVIALMADLAAAGVSLAAEGDRLFCRPRATLTPELAHRVKANKPALLEALRPKRLVDGAVTAEQRLLADIGLWTDAARALYRERLRAAAVRGLPVHLGSVAESVAREDAEIESGWHAGWPPRRKRGGAA